jgi:hypothetical protein
LDDLFLEPVHDVDIERLILQYKAMAQAAQSPLPYPNPSLGQIAATEDVDSESHQTTHTMLPNRKHPIQGARQVVLIIS